MNPRLDLLLPLAPLFAALLAGCKPDNPCEGIEEMPYTNTVLLTPAEYEQWQMGMQPGDPTTGAATSTGSSTATSTATDGAASTGTDSGTAGGTTGAGEPGSSTAGDPAEATLSDQEICAMVCSHAGYFDFQSCTVGAPIADGRFPVDCSGVAQCMVGRRHACVRSRGDIASATTAATWLARAAHDEAASVHAFEALGAELLAHSAPAELLARITLAADDERRHAAMVTDLAQRRGAAVPMPIVTPTPTRDLLALAVENMVEGCVEETWAALFAAHQARHAHSPELRDLYAGIADDERRHAELAWSIHTWLFGQLSEAGRDMVAAARRAAVRQLHTNLAALADEPELLALGVPGRSTALHLLTGLDAALWSQAA